MNIIHSYGCFIRFLFYLAYLHMNMVSFTGVSKNIKVHILKGQCDGRKPFKFCYDFTVCEIITIRVLSVHAA